MATEGWAGFLREQEKRMEEQSYKELIAENWAKRIGPRTSALTGHEVLVNGQCVWRFGGLSGSERRVGEDLCSQSEWSFHNRSWLRRRAESKAKRAWWKERKGA